MRTPLLATLFGLSLVACAGQIDGGGVGDDVAPNCGNGVMDEGETCDDGNTASGDGCSSACLSEAPPSLRVSVDKPTLTTELDTTNMVTVTLTGGDGFAGTVGLAAAVTDALNAPLATWITAINPPSVTVPLNGTATAVVTVSVPSENKGLIGNLKITTTSTATGGVHDATSMITALNQVSLKMTSNNGQCVYPAGTVSITEGTKIRFVNGGTVNLIVHSNGGAYGIAHGDTTPGNEITPTNAYERTVSVGSADGAPFTWYCHAPGPDLGGGNPAILVTAP